MSIRPRRALSRLAVGVGLLGPLLLNGAVASAVQAPQAAAAPAQQVAAAQLQPTLAASMTSGYYQTPYASHIYRLSATARTHLTFQQWLSAGSPSPRRTPTEFVKYPWAPAVYGVTYWPGSWQWDHVSWEGFVRAGFPAVRHAGWIEGSVIVQDAGNPALYLRDPQGAEHRLTYGEWQATGFRPPIVRGGASSHTGAPASSAALPYSSGSFFKSSARSAPIDAALTSRFHSFMATHPDQRGVSYPVIRGTGGNKWGTPFAVGRPGDVRWTLTGNVPAEVADLRTTGFYAPAGFGASITGTSDSPFVVNDQVLGQSVWGAKAVVKPGYVIEVGAAGRFMHSSNGLDRRNKRSDDARNFRSRGAIPDAMVIRRDLMDAAIAQGSGLGHVLHFFIVESDTAAGVVHPMVGEESGKYGFGAEGTRIVLRPDFPVESLATQEAKVLARTLIENGMYIGDNAGTGSSLKAQQDVGGQVWGGRLGPDTLNGMSWNDFRVVSPGWQ